MSDKTISKSEINDNRESNKKMNELIQEVMNLRSELKEWKNDLIEEFSELTVNLVEHFQQVIDKHILKRESYVNEEYFDCRMSDKESESDSESEELTEEEEEDNESKEDNRSDGLVVIDENEPQNEDLTEFLSEVD